ncbi:MAG: ArsC/Spx/MgsR family protein [Pseudomonadota bacterium]
MKLYGLKSCDTCKKALKALDAAEFIDVRADGVPDDVLNAAYAQFGDALVNRASTTWRGLSDEEKAGNALDLLEAHPTLMKRPLIVSGDKMTLGWKADAQEAWA